MPRGCAGWAWEDDGTFLPEAQLPCTPISRDLVPPNPLSRGPAPLHPSLQRPAPTTPHPAAFPTLAEAQDWLCPQDTWAGQGAEGQVDENETTPKARQLLPSVSRPARVPASPATPMPTAGWPSGQGAGPAL